VFLNLVNVELFVDADSSDVLKPAAAVAIALRLFDSIAVLTLSYSYFTFSK
jgi:hypothetical protein